jgi:hypothetical protein
VIGEAEAQRGRAAWFGELPDRDHAVSDEAEAQQGRVNIQKERP